MTLLQAADREFPTCLFQPRLLVRERGSVNRHHLVISSCGQFFNLISVSISEAVICLGFRHSADFRYDLFMSETKRVPYCPLRTLQNAVSRLGSPLRWQCSPLACPISGPSSRLAVPAMEQCRATSPGTIQGEYPPHGPPTGAFCRLQPHRDRETPETADGITSRDP